MENDLSQEGLGCCACEEKSMGTAGLTCADKKNILTRREHEVLDRIREASFRASALKEEIRLTDEDRRQSALQELERLRLLRAELEEERVAASDERMRMLGHL